MADGPDALEARLQRLEDLEEIRDLQERYLRHLDRGEFAEYAALFAKDGKMRLGPARRVPPHRPNGGRVVRALRVVTSSAPNTTRRERS